MLNSIKQILGFGPKVNFADLMKSGAVIVDVRTKKEFQGGHIKKSTNMPLDTLNNNLGRLNDKDQPIITCCASGMRSASAKRILKAKGFKEVYNGGAWNSLESKI
ncbi:rhodanese-like domain-containing protein [Cyclobacterium sp. 1_MG-2023]|uniref:rhodanese-like domain-containing protein n=1 Tax=Cyclobacterium sp. 1_MG-2023 TaxID=3062681 RepID=UPI0026E461D8|nr:rhodanese-like domain-containing protein [Cyclobacterium sp. 1_MG-2023]MDO6438952.1 rhodanese-like domain-containing protein [Cyclobacterium sp. 1_MG-2023]